jgi:hypothetical protein
MLIAAGSKGSAYPQPTQQTGMTHATQGIIVYFSSLA